MKLFARNAGGVEAVPTGELDVVEWPDEDVTPETTEPRPAPSESGPQAPVQHIRCDCSNCRPRPLAIRLRNMVIYMLVSMTIAGAVLWYALNQLSGALDRLH